MEKNIERIERKYIFISGTIGAGKSTIVEKIKERFANASISVIKEYIDYDPEGDKMLNEYLSGKMTCFDFQVYMLQQYEKQINGAEGKVLLFERHPLEGLLFASVKLSEDELHKLYNVMMQFIVAAKIPAPWKCSVKEYDGEDNYLLEKICHDIQYGTKTICHIAVSEQEQVLRLLRRNRQSDIDYLSEQGMKYLRHINELYRATVVIKYHLTPHYWTIFYRNRYDPIPIVMNVERHDENNSEY